MNFDKVLWKRPYLGFYKSYQTKVATFWIAQILRHNCVENTKNYFSIRKKVIEQIAKNMGYFLAFENNFFASIFLQEGASCSLSSAFSSSILER